MKCLSMVCAVILLAPVMTGIAFAQSQAPTPPRRLAARTLPLTHFYDGPQPLPLGKPGDLIRSESFDDYDLPLDVSVLRILYHSRSASGEDVASSGVVLFPAEKKPPPGGWPVIAWAHGMTGVARTCAPSLRRNIGHGSFLSMYVNLGYAVIASDYTGLGTSFRNAFMDAPSNATDVIASIPAARAALPQLGSRWIVMGAEQGGLTAVAVAEREGEMHDAGYLGAIVIADLAAPHEMIEKAAQPGSSITLASLAYGVKTVHPQFQIADMLTEKGLKLYEAIEQTCSDAGAIPEIAPAETVKKGWENKNVVRDYLARSIPGRIRARGPVLVISSNADQTNPRKPTSAAVSQLCKQGDQVQWERYSDLDPGRVIGDSVRDQIAWLEGRLAGRPAITNCP